MGMDNKINKENHREKKRDFLLSGPTTINKNQKTFFMCDFP